MFRRSWQLIYRMYRYIKPVLEQEFGTWYKRAEQIPDSELRRQALASMSTKKFHCEGGCVYASQTLSYINVLVPLIIAYQTISDYLDNLCDRSTSLDPQDFRQLHLSMQDALTPDAPLRDYYLYREEKDDGGFLASLVRTCQESIRQLPSYAIIQQDVVRLSTLYSELQVYKHIAHDQREAALLNWWKPYQEKYPNIYWQEFSAVTGSTIGIFALFALATAHDLEEQTVTTVIEAYFPWICGLHILLDYLIDLEEDRQGGDLNFVSYYDTEQEAITRLQFFIQQAKLNAKKLPNSEFHQMIVDGLVALYLADRKVNRNQPEIYLIAKQLLRYTRGFPSWFFYINSLLLRR
ncbi:tetraprenyl-beta-curcumene synthase family protein [Brevibacillus fulvus]|uniref:Tetraprenyl-beta-curcumene synthase n=1 Tax=Brevibacillus fulvus TaxID=1125967 RepID=A0A938XXN6_9BACL|nr:tetraprenyl-beta-curcumene synthase family protein [Brevibacillus fulvus]MBM7589766.1 tetraprenyl-beta-curcumene synthase [Brevibacillus fulvus]